jgi:cytidyltransferase-like protein
LEEAARLGPVHVLLWSDDAARSLHGHSPKFPQAERQYLLEAIRYVDRVTLWPGTIDPDALPPSQSVPPAIWVVDEASDNAARRAFCRARGLDYHVLRREQTEGFPEWPANLSRGSPGRKRVIVTGCFDWFHSGHVRFFEEVSALGDLYVVVGHDANIRLLKGPGHPMFPAQERRYMVQSVRYVTEALISTGDGWLDAAPEIERLKPDVYAVNEDGDRPEKRQYCEAHAVEYRVLKRIPKQGLPRRQSTTLRGF